MNKFLAGGAGAAEKCINNWPSPFASSLKLLFGNQFALHLVKAFLRPETRLYAEFSIRMKLVLVARKRL